MTEPEEKTGEAPDEIGRPLKMKKILVPTDFSERSSRSLANAVALAKHFDAYLFLMHVLTEVDDLGRSDHASPVYQAQRKAAECAVEKILASRQLQGLPHEVLLEDGYLWPTIEQFVHKHEIDLVAVGTDGVSGAQRDFSPAEIVLRNVDCLVMTTGPACPGDFGPGHPPAERALRRILFATDFGRAAMHSTSFAVGLAQAYGAKLTLLHVVDSRPNSDAEYGILRETSRIRLVESVPEDVARCLQMETQVEFGETPAQILKVARAKQADMIVMGARAGITPEAQQMPSLIYIVAGGAPCPLITIRR